MQMSNLQNNNNKSMKKIKKSQVLLIGSLLVFIGILLLISNTFSKIRDEVYSDMKIGLVTKDESGNEKVSTVPVANNVSSAEPATEETKEPEIQEINYDRYLGVLEIPKIGLKRGFYNFDNKYNNIEYNVTLVQGSDMPNEERGNLILMAHSGDAYISYFAYLYRLNVGDRASVTYQKTKYNYQVVNIYEVPKVGRVPITRDYNKTVMTLITCTKDNDSTQTVYILEQV